MHDAPPWLQRWRLRAQEHPEIEVLEPERAAQERERLLALYERGGPQGVPLTPQPLELAQRLLERLTPVALGPAYPSRIEGVWHRPWLWASRQQPQQLLLSLHELMPPFLWFAVGQDLQGVFEALDADTTCETSPALELPRVCRAFMGTHELLETDLDGLMQHLSVCPFVESLFWGSAHDEDPWPLQIDASLLDTVGLEATVQLAQQPQSPRSLSLRTVASRSVLTIEDHEGVFVAQARYEPASHAEQILAINAQFGAHYPADLPLDVVAALLGFYFEGAPALREFMAQTQDGEELALYLHVLSCVRHGEVGLAEELRPWLAHRDEQVRLIAAEVALRQGFDALVLSRLFAEPDEALRELLIASLWTDAPGPRLVEGSP